MKIRDYKLINGYEVARLSFDTPVDGPKECLDFAIELFKKKLNSDAIAFDNIICIFGDADDEYTGLMAVVEPKIVRI